VQLDIVDVVGLKGLLTLIAVYVQPELDSEVTKLIDLKIIIEVEPELIEAPRLEFDLAATYVVRLSASSLYYLK